MPTDEELGRGKTCFVIGPIGDRMAPTGTPARTIYEESVLVWERVIEPVCAEFGLDVIRADRIARAGEITEQIVRLLYNADIVIADVSGGNANVMYELGLRHTRPLPTVIIGEYERLPFDISVIRAIPFQRTEAGRIEVRDMLREFVRNGLTSSHDPVTATRVWSESHGMNAEELQAAVQQSELPEILEDDDEPGVAEVLADGEEGLGEVAAVMGAISDTIGAIGAITRRNTGAIAESDAAKKGFAGRLVVIRNFAEELKEPAARLEGKSVEFEDCVRRMDLMNQYVLRERDASNEEQSALGEYARAIMQLSGAAAETVDQIGGYLQAVRGMKKLSRDLAPTSQSLAASSSRIMENSRVVAGWRDLAVRWLGEEHETGRVDLGDGD